MEVIKQESVLKDKKIAVLTLGCKVNQYETDGMRERLEVFGCEFVEFSEEADIYLVNTCSVTNMAERKSRQMLHRAKKQNPEALVAAVGCYVQSAPREVLEDLSVDVIIGNNCKKNVAEILEKTLKNRSKQQKTEQEGPENQSSRNDQTEKQLFLQNHQRPEEIKATENRSNNTDDAYENHKNMTNIVNINNIDNIARTNTTDLTNAVEQYWIPIGETREYEELKLTHMQEHTRAYIKIQDGCNQFCSYCIIPYVRGRIRSRKPEEILEEVRRLTEKGCKEVVLTGIHLSSYGKDWNKMHGGDTGAGGNDSAKDDRQPDGARLLEVIRLISGVEGIVRIRLGSLEPRIITKEFAEELKRIPKVCPHFHLSLQSGCNETLKRMNRKYTIEEYMESCKLLRQTFDRPALTTDVIAGFPGETEAEFETTCRNLEKLSLYEIHVFKYSRRRGTVAESLPNQVPEQEKTRRSEVLLEMTARQKQAYENSFRGEPVQVLIEEMVEKKEKDWYVGHTERYMKVEVQSEQDIRNRMITVNL